MIDTTEVNSRATNPWLFFKSATNNCRSQHEMEILLFIQCILLILLWTIYPGFPFSACNQKQLHFAIKSKRLNLIFHGRLLQSFSQLKFHPFLTIINICLHPINNLWIEAFYSQHGRKDMLLVPLHRNFKMWQIANALQVME